MATKKASKKAAPRTAKERTATRQKPAAKRAAAKKPAANARAAKAPTIRFGRAGTAGKAEGAEAVHAVFASRPAEQRAIMERIDTIIGRQVPAVRRAIKWSMPVYGLEGKGWFCFLAGFKDYVRLGFYHGSDLKPEPPTGEGKGMRAIRYTTLADVDEKLVASWVKQAAAIPGWGKA